MLEHIKNAALRRVKQCVDDRLTGCGKITRKKQLMKKRGAEIIKAEARGKINGIREESELKRVDYDLELSLLIKQKNRYYLEQEVENRVATFYQNVFVSDEEQEPAEEEADYRLAGEFAEEAERLRFIYDRLRAVQYAERWWNDYNPRFEKFAVDCTNFISQCLYAGGAPMRGYPDRSKGWWMQNKNWSYSWSTSHSLRQYLLSSKVGLRGKRVAHPAELKLGDVIFYDFQGNGRFDHSTIVTAKDADGMPLVNAHTTNSRMRYWSYEDSSAYTENIQYTFVTIVDDREE